ncbi:uncharacterized protein [Rutidosis leptorrhynchoides]|uniref:uncharacterized protein n=1 Tax=Rutidosis leptorrhynchoides TaxID=125765 RepID=UPI003A9A17C3
MGVKLTSGCLNWSKTSNYWPVSSPPHASAISSPSSTRIVFRYVHQPIQFGAKLNKSKRRIEQAVNASLNTEFYSEEEFSKEINELSVMFQSSNDNMIPASIERKANSVELPFSLRMIQKKKQWKEGVRGIGETAYCSVKKAFSSMVFIIRELQSYTLQMREALFYEDLQEVLVRVQQEMNASFVWLFQQVFSHTPTFMVHVMILLANYSVYAVSNNVAFAVGPPPAVAETISYLEQSTKIDSSSMKTFEVKSSGKTASIGGNNGGGGGGSNVMASGTDGGESEDGVVTHDKNIIPDVDWLTSRISPLVSGQVTREHDTGLWKLIVQEANNMQDVIRYGVLDHQTMLRFVSPVTAKICVGDENDSKSHLRTELLYQMGLSEEPDNPLLLANYAQFLYIVAQDYDRAEDYFKRASKVEPKDAEALSKYANFLWEIRKDLWAAEHTLLEAISVDPINPFYAATYANFLWSNGPDDPCVPIDSSEIVNSDDL